MESISKNRNIYTRSWFSPSLNDKRKVHLADSENMNIKNQTSESMVEVKSDHNYLSNVRRFFCSCKYFYWLCKTANQSSALRSAASFFLIL